MTKKELSQIFYLNNELKMWIREREKLEYRLGSSGKWIDGMPRGSGTSDPTGNLASELAQCKMLIGCKEVEIQYQRNKAIKYIDGINDSLLRQILFYRCVSLMSWQEVADNIGGKQTANSVRMGFKRHFERSADEREI